MQDPGSRYQDRVSQGQNRVRSGPSRGQIQERHEGGGEITHLHTGQGERVCFFLNIEEKMLSIPKRGKTEEE